MSLDQEKWPDPIGYRYLYPTYDGCQVWRFDTGGREINGFRPVRSEPVYAAPTPPQPQAVVDRVSRLEEALREVLDIAEMYVPAPLDAPGFKRARAALSNLVLKGDGMATGDPAPGAP